MSAALLLPFGHSFKEFLRMALLLWPDCQPVKETLKEYEEKVDAMTSDAMRVVPLTVIVKKFSRAFGMTALQAFIDAKGEMAVMRAQETMKLNKEHANSLRTAAVLTVANDLDASQFADGTLFSRVANDDMSVVHDVCHPLIVDSGLAQKFDELKDPAGFSEKMFKKRMKNRVAIWRYFKKMVMNADMCDVTAKLPSSVLRAAENVQQRKGSRVTVRSSAEAAQKIAKNMSKQDKRQVKNAIKGKGQKEVMTMIKSSIRTSQEIAQQQQSAAMKKRHERRKAALAAKEAELAAAQQARVDNDVDREALIAELLREEEEEDKKGNQKK